MTQRLEPLRFERHFVEKVWGGRALEKSPGIELPSEKAIGETWEIVDRENENSVVAEGVFRGKTLREMMAEFGSDILGSASAVQDGRFPLLVKYLDAQQHLSIQVHPDDASAARLGGGAEAKTEAWYVLESTPEGRVYAGLRAGVDSKTFADVARTQAIVEALHCYEVQRGDCLLIRGGTVHAIGAGVTILEVQQNSDTTYRLYDWGRAGLDGKPRETHVEEALACVTYPDANTSVEARPVRPRFGPLENGLSRAPLAHSHVFRMDALRIDGRAQLETEGAFRIYCVVDGTGRLGVGDAPSTLLLSRGDVWLVPASCGTHCVEPEGGMLSLVEMAHR